MKLTRLLIILTIALFSIGLFPAHAQTNQTLTVFAAASLTNAFEQIAAAFEVEHPGVEVAFNFGGSSDLAAQIVEGAPADVFASANTKQMQAAQDAERISGEAQIFVQNRLVVIAPSDNPAEVTALRDLAKPGLKLVLAAPDVPVRDYTDAMLDKLAEDPAYGEDYRAAVLANLVSEEPNVRQVAAKIALGEADAGVVYISDVTRDIADQVLTIPVPDEVNMIAAYPIAITKDAADPELAQAFVDFVLSDAGQVLLARWNFVPVRACSMAAAS